MKRTVFLEAHNRHISLAHLCDIVRRAKAHPAAEFTGGLNEWWPVTGATIVAEFRAGLDDRITRRLPWAWRGRKWTPEYQAALRRDVQNIRARTQVRVRSYELLTPELRPRYAHLLSDRHEV